MVRSLFAIYGLMVAGWVGWSQYRGWSLDQVREVKNVPKSIRDNPGAWRSHYGYYGGRYYGGK
ncbi:MAG: hypothetical protein HY235_23475 [Acidobacteria bacterium]|nr:hypothetical protein [Acidobacteriota bacterium]